jgi:GTP cyclohydrolase I
MTHDDNPKDCLRQLNSATTSVLDALAEFRGFDRDDPNLADTPSRVAKAMLEITEGYGADIKGLLAKSFPSEDYNQMIVVKDIDYYSTCAHHMMPFHGKVAVGYIPNKETRMVVGLSKIPRIVRAFSRRLQNQERMTMQIANAMEENLKPRGVGVIVYDSVHLCSHMRGVEESHSTMETSALKGEFLDDPTVRQEFMMMVYGRR